jgi:hypothetical protein
LGKVSNLKTKGGGFFLNMEVALAVDFSKLEYVYVVINRFAQEQAGLEAQEKKQMSRIILINLIRFVMLVLLQVFLLKNITLYNLSTPYLYILFILLLPFETPNLVLFALAFVLGLTIDAFYDTPGLHAALAFTGTCKDIIYQHNRTKRWF